MASARARSRGHHASSLGGEPSSSALDNTSRSNSLLKLLLSAAVGVLALAAYVARTSPSIAAQLLDLPVLDATNIGNVRPAEFMAYGPIDVVYTWVNGTDPRWKAEKEYWHKHWIASLTGQPLPQKPEDTKHVKGSDTANADNRFRDNEELRYSLRSLEKYAPWIRHIYVVTDGQIPAWLNIESPKINIIKHSEIFTNKSHLPVFSSPAIEWNLDNIPGLSDSFLYFNDDVFLGSHVHPEDFVSQMGVQKAYFAWEIPLCSPGCWESSLNNDRCDRECNVTACDFDMGDCGCDVSDDGTVSCDPVKIASIQETAPKPPKTPEYLCQGSCHYKWIGDGGCDLSCNISACGFDAGDCGGTDSLVDLFSADLTENHTLVQVPLTVNATYLNLTEVFGVNGTIAIAEHDNEPLVRHATVFEKEMLLLLVFGRDDEGDAFTNSAVFNVFGKDVNGTDIRLDFSLVRGNKMVASALEGGYYTFQNTTIKPRSVRLPFGLRQAEIQDRKDSEDEQSTVDTDASDTGDDDESESRTPTSLESSNLQELEVILPFNLTGKHLKGGDVLELGYDVSLRLHDDEDFDWSEFQLCRVRIPSAETKKAPEPVDAVVAEVEDISGATNAAQSSGSLDSAAGVEATVGDVASDPSVASDSDEPPPGPGKSFAFDALELIGESEGAEAQEEIRAAAAAAALGKVREPQNTFAFNVLDHIREKDGAPTHDETTTPLNTIQDCRLVDNGRAIALTFKIPTFKVRDEAPKETVVVESVEEAPAATRSRDTPSSISPGATSSSPEAVGSTTTSTAATNEGASTVTTTTTTTVVATELADSPHRPQVVDGSICFFNADLGDNAKRYCFAVAVGHFHPHREVVAHKPTLLAQLQPPVKLRPEVVYEPYSGEDHDVLVELIDVCIETTLRAIGLEPRVCDLLEVPSVLPGGDDDGEDGIPGAFGQGLQAKNEEDGRRMACEAKQRRLAARDEHKQQEEAIREAGGTLYNGKQWVTGTLERVKSVLGLATVVETDDGDIDDVEYADVCKPYIQETAPTPSPGISKENADALLSKDTFGDSLRFVNKLYNRAFGKAPDRRRVPSHMPFLFKKAVIREIKQRWHREIDATSAHRFRHPQDMQFSFSYFHYVLNRHKAVHPTLEEIWTEYLDANRNGILDENELLTAASLAHGDYPPDAFVTEVRACLQPPKQEHVREKASGKGTVRVTETLTPHITFAQLQNCADIASKLLKNVRREKQCEVMPEDEVTFHMLSENYRFAWNQMLGTRARRTKFVCINDDMKYPSASVSQILHELFLSIWPKRSQFELPYHLKNRYAHIDEYNDARERRRVYVGLGVGVLLLAVAYFWSELKRLFGFQDIARARAESASKLSMDLQRELMEEQNEDDAREHFVGDKKRD
ncbi:N-acetylglucosamine-1-phosphotransferase subunits alpha/beta [Globisporangium polare]